MSTFSNSPADICTWYLTVTCSSTCPKNNSSSPSLSLPMKLLYLLCSLTPWISPSSLQAFKSETWITFPRLSSLVRHQVLSLSSLEYLYNLSLPHYPCYCCFKQAPNSQISARDFWMGSLPAMSPSPVNLPHGYTGVFFKMPTWNSLLSALKCFSVLGIFVSIDLFTSC